MNQEKKTLWTKNYTCITTASILSAIGGEAMGLPISLLVFEETQSTFLAALIMVCGILPDMLLSVFIAPIIDKDTRKKWIIGLDVLLMLVYLLMGIWVSDHEFQYGLYIVFTLIVGTISVFYRLAYSAWYPELIPVGFEQKGYAVSGTIYPLVTIVMSPIATLMYEKITISNIFFLVAGISLISIIIEGQIKEGVREEISNYSFAQYKEDLVEGFTYLKQEKGIRNIYSYMAVTQGVSDGTTVAIQAFFQTHPGLTVTMLGVMKSAEMIGRVISGMIQYKIEIPAKKRYGVTKFVYTFYQLADMILLLSPYPVMLANRFLCGGLGTMSATLRETAVQSYLPSQMRARVNAVFQVIFSIGGIGFQFVAGVLGELLPYRLVVIVLGVLSLFAIWAFIVIPDKDNRPVYEAERKW